MRAFEETHSWITFDATEINELDPRIWMELGEARSKCEHIAGAPLQPAVAQQLYQVTLVKGAQATVAIEGNTMTVEQVEGIYRGEYKAPTSRAYQEREVQNVLDALMKIDDQIVNGMAPTITTDLICEYNGGILDGTEYEEHIAPGKIRDYSVGVSGYRGAPAEDCKHLVEQLAHWLESDTFKSDDQDVQFALAVISAVLAHLYIAWIHPFGDGNGRTARLLEFLILARCGMVPLPAAHLLSNHYNLTRDQYYRELDRASKTKSISGFIRYAVEGLADGLREQIDMVREQQFRVTWINYVHETMNKFPSNATRDRQRSLVLAMPSGEWLARDELPGLTPKLAAAYAKTGPRTLARDLNRLKGEQLVRNTGRNWISNDQVIRAFLPPMANGQEQDPK